MPDGDELLRQRILELEKEVDAATTARHAAEVPRAKTTERDVAAERSLEVFSEASTERDAEYTTAEYLAAALADDYLAAARALGVSTEAATRPGVMSAGEVGATKRPAVKQQEHAPWVETLGDDGEPPESELAVTGVVHAERQQEPSPPVTSAEPFHCC